LVDKAGASATVNKEEVELKLQVTLVPFIKHG
jgi:hypothetical protein